MGGKPEKLKEVQHRTLYRTDESEEEEVKGTVLEDGGKDVSIVPILYPRGIVSVSSLGYFSSVGYSYKPSHTSLPVSVGACHIQEYFKKNRGRKSKFIKPQQDKARHEKQMKQGKVIVRAKLVIGYWELIPIELGAEFLAPQDTATVRVSEEILAAKKQRNYWWKEDNWPRPKKYLVNGQYPYLRVNCGKACLDLVLDPVLKQTIFNVLQKIGRKLTTYENDFPRNKRAFLS